MKRLKNWDSVGYHNFLIERAHAPFAWGTNDCSSFAVDGIKAITGVDIALDFRTSKYSTKEEAFALITSVTGGSTVADAAAWCAKKHELMEWEHPLCAQRGDLVVIVAPTGDLVSGLVHLNGQIVAMGEDGLYILSITKVKRAFHV